MKNFIKIIGIVALVFVAIYANSIETSAALAMLFPAMGTDNMRILYNKIRQDYADFRIIPGYYVKTCQALSDTKTLYTFNVTDKNAISYPSHERYLSTNDRLIVTHLGFHIGMYVSTTDSLVRWHTYPSLFFDSVSPSSFNELHLNAIWASGDLKLTVNNYEYLERHSLLQHQIIPDKMYGEVVAASNDPITSPIVYQTYTVGYDGYKPGDGFVETTPNLILNGSDDIKLQIEFDAFANIKIAHDGSNATNLMAVTLYGFLVKNAAPIRQRI